MPKRGRSGAAPSTRPQKKTRSRTTSSTVGKRLRYGKRKRAAKKGSRKRARKGNSVSQLSDITSDLVNVKRTLGRKAKLSLSNLSQKIKAGTDNIILRYQGINLYSSPQAFFLLDRVTSGATPAYYENIPIMLFNLSQNWLNSSAGLGGTGAVSPAGWRLNRFGPQVSANPVYDYQFAPLNAQNQLGSTVSTPPYNTESAPKSGVLENKYDQLEWVDARLSCVGPTTYLCNWEISLITLKEDMLCPEFDATTTAGVGNFDDYLNQKLIQRMQFWGKMSAPLISHPINVNFGTFSTKGMYKVLYSTKFTTGPKESIDQMTTGQERQIKLFKWMNRLQNYMWAQPGAPPGPTGLNENMGYDQNNGSVAGSLQTDVDWSKRVYLMVKAQNNVASNVAATAQAAGVCPSFDLLIRKKHISGF